ncbi:MAG TPA: SIMPL domain-containing protein [Methanocorpusculum sp.]|nr:SIMPL domain-containing protein [Methanocorpusculum sp.]
MVYDMKSAAEVPVLNVSGRGRSHAEPDRFSVRFSVGLEHPDDDFIFQTVSNITEKLITALKEWAKEGDSIQTESFTNRHYEYDKKSGKWPYGKMISYVCSTIRVDSARVGEVSTLINLGKKAGATSVSDVDFRLSDKLAREQRGIALREAIKAAEFDARVTADAMGLTISRPLSITVDEEYRHYNTYSRNICMNKMSACDDEADDFIESGEIATSASVSVVYSIGQSCNRTIKDYVVE